MESKRTVGVRPIALNDVKHIKVHYDDHLSSIPHMKLENRFPKVP